MLFRSTPTLHLLLPSDLARLPSVRRQVWEFLADCGVDEQSIWEIVLSLHEALKNAIRFTDSRQDIQLDLTVVDHAVHAGVKDHGAGFDGGVLPERQSVDQPDLYSTSGRGLYLMSHFMDEVTLAADHGAEVQMIKRLPSV